MIEHICITCRHAIKHLNEKPCCFCKNGAGDKDKWEEPLWAESEDGDEET